MEASIVPPEIDTSATMSNVSPPYPWFHMEKVLAHNPRYSSNETRGNSYCDDYLWAKILPFVYCNDCPCMKMIFYLQANLGPSLHGQRQREIDSSKYKGRR
jgi:hypothetical protein